MMSMTCQVSSNIQDLRGHLRASGLGAAFLSGAKRVSSCDGHLGGRSRSRVCVPRQHWCSL